MSDNRQSLTQIYTSAVYAVFDGKREIRFCVGENSAEINGLLEKHEAEKFAFLTAHNPRSKVLSHEENDLRQLQLKRILEAGNLSFLEGYGTNESESWGREDSLFILDVSEETALELAAQFEQHAILYATKNEKCRLVWV